MQGTIERGVYGTATEILELAEGWKAVIYQDTGVVRWTSNNIILTAPEGAKTQTTKLRMNQASYQFNLGFIVVQRRGKWYVYKSRIDENGKLKHCRNGKLADFDGYKVHLHRRGENLTHVARII